MKLLHEFEHGGRTMRMYLGTYAQRRGPGPRVPAIEVRSLDPDMGGMESPYGRLTVNLPESSGLGPWGIHVKTWNENEEVARMAMATGVFSELEFPVATGRTQATTWSIRPDRIRLEALGLAVSELGFMPSRRQALTVMAREARAWGAEKIQVEMVDGAGHHQAMLLDFDRSGELVLTAVDPDGPVIGANALDAGAMDCTAFGCRHQFTGHAAEDRAAMKAFVSDVLGGVDLWVQTMLNSQSPEPTRDRPGGY